MTKVKYVLNPYLKDEDKYKEIRNCNSLLKLGDLWGPLLMTISLSLSLAWDISDKGTLFVLVFTIFWIGGVVVTINAQLLGVKV
jgi:hypothetical protein